MFAMSTKMFEKVLGQIGIEKQIIGVKKRATVERQFTQRARKGDTRVGILTYRAISCWERKGTPSDWRS